MAPAEPHALSRSHRPPAADSRNLKSELPADQRGYQVPVDKHATRGRSQSARACREITIRHDDSAMTAVVRDASVNFLNAGVTNVPGVAFHLNREPDHPLLRDHIHA